MARRKSKVARDPLGATGQEWLRVQLDGLAKAGA